MGGKYFWGAPIGQKARLKAWDVIREDSDDATLTLILNFYLNRVTEKTSAVLTLAGLVFAMSLFVMERKFDLMVGFSGLSSTVGIMLLAMNLGTVWHRDQSNWKPHPGHLIEMYLLFSRRVVRLQVALWLIGIAAILSVAALFESEMNVQALVELVMSVLSQLTTSRP